MKIISHILIGALMILMSSFFVIKNNIDFFITKTSTDSAKILIFLKPYLENSEVINFTNKIKKEFENVTIKTIYPEESVKLFKEENETFAKNFDLDNDVKELIPIVLELEHSNLEINFFHKLQNTITKLNFNENVDEIIDEQNFFKNSKIINNSVNGFFTFVLITFLGISFLMISLLVAKAVHDEKDFLKIKFYFGQSFKSLVFEKVVLFSKFYFTTLLTSFLFFYSVFLILKVSLNVQFNLEFISNHLCFLNLKQILLLLTLFSTSYFISIVVSIKTTLKDTLHNQ